MSIVLNLLVKWRNFSTSENPFLSKHSADIRKIIDCFTSFEEERVKPDENSANRISGFLDSIEKLCEKQTTLLAKAYLEYAKTPLLKEYGALLLETISICHLLSPENKFNEFQRRNLLKELDLINNHANKISREQHNVEFAQKLIPKLISMVTNVEQYAAKADSGFTFVDGVGFHSEYFKEGGELSAKQKLQNTYLIAIGQYIQIYKMAVSKNEVLEFFRDGHNADCLNGNIGGKDDSSTGVYQWARSKNYFANLGVENSPLPENSKPMESESAGSKSTTSRWVTLLLDSIDDSTFDSNVGSLSKELAMEFSAKTIDFTTNHITGEEYLEYVIKNSPSAEDKTKEIRMVITKLFTTLGFILSEEFSLPISNTPPKVQKEKDYLFKNYSTKGKQNSSFAEYVPKNATETIVSTTQSFNAHHPRSYVVEGKLVCEPLLHILLRYDNSQMFQTVIDRKPSDFSWHVVNAENQKTVLIVMAESETAKQIIPFYTHIMCDSDEKLLEDAKKILPLQDNKKQTFLHALLKNPLVLSEDIKEILVFIFGNLKKNNDHIFLASFVFLPDADGKNILGYAAEKNMEAVVRYLINILAELTVSQNDPGLITQAYYNEQNLQTSAVYLAKKHKAFDSLAYLANAGAVQILKSEDKAEFKNRVFSPTLIDGGITWEANNTLEAIQATISPQYWGMLLKWAEPKDLFEKRRVEFIITNLESSLPLPHVNTEAIELSDFEQAIAKFSHDYYFLSYKINNANIEFMKFFDGLFNANLSSSKLGVLLHYLAFYAITYFMFVYPVAVRVNPYFRSLDYLNNSCPTYGGQAPDPRNIWPTAEQFAAECCNGIPECVEENQPHWENAILHPTGIGNPMAGAYFVSLFVFGTAAIFNWWLRQCIWRNGHFPRIHKLTIPEEHIEGTKLEAIKKDIKDFYKALKEDDFDVQIPSLKNFSEIKTALQETILFLRRIKAELNTPLGRTNEFISKFKNSEVKIEVRMDDVTDDVNENGDVTEKSPLLSPDSQNKPKSNWLPKFC